MRAAPWMLFASLKLVLGLTSGSGQGEGPWRLNLRSFAR
jgi:hypothetical protein